MIGQFVISFSHFCIKLHLSKTVKCDWMATFPQRVDSNHRVTIEKCDWNSGESDGFQWPFSDEKNWTILICFHRTSRGIFVNEQAPVLPIPILFAQFGLFTVHFYLKHWIDLKPGFKMPWVELFGDEVSPTNILTVHFSAQILSRCLVYYHLQCKIAAKMVVNIFIVFFLFFFIFCKRYFILDLCKILRNNFVHGMMMVFP